MCLFLLLEVKVALFIEKKHEAEQSLNQQKSIQACWGDRE